MSDMSTKINSELNSQKPPKFLCGIVEGFYGRPWTIEQRKELFKRMNKLQLNTYMYAPKDDTKHRTYWRDLYSKAEGECLTSLIKCAKQNNIDFYYALSPGLNITFSKTKDIEAIKKKMDQVATFGCTSFALLFDDIDAELSVSDKLKFKSFADAQSIVTNEIYEHLGKPNFMFCPTEYCVCRAVPNVTSSDYLKTLGLNLNPAISVMWTGPRVVSKRVNRSGLEELKSVLPKGNNLILWDNIHANDYDPKRIFLGPFKGRDQDIISGYGLEEDDINVNEYYKEDDNMKVNNTNESDKISRNLPTFSGNIDDEVSSKSPNKAVISKNDTGSISKEILEPYGLKTFDKHGSYRRGPLDGVLSNPNCEFEANYVAIHTLAQWSKIKMDPVIRENIAATENCEALAQTKYSYDPRIALEIALTSWLDHVNSRAPYLVQIPRCLTTQSGISATGGGISGYDSSAYLNYYGTATNNLTTLPDPVISKPAPSSNNSIPSSSSSIDSSTSVTSTDVCSIPKIKDKIVFKDIDNKNASVKLEQNELNNFELEGNEDNSDDQSWGSGPRRSSVRYNSLSEDHHNGKKPLESFMERFLKLERSYYILPSLHMQPVNSLVEKLKDEDLNILLPSTNDDAKEYEEDKDANAINHFEVICINVNEYTIGMEKNNDGKQIVPVQNEKSLAPPPSTSLEGHEEKMDCTDIKPGSPSKANTSIQSQSCGNTNFDQPYSASFQQNMGDSDKPYSILGNATSTSSTTPNITFPYLNDLEPLKETCYTPTIPMSLSTSSSNRQASIILANQTPTEGLECDMDLEREIKGTLDYYKAQTLSDAVDQMASYSSSNHATPTLHAHNSSLTSSNLSDPTIDSNDNPRKVQNSFDVTKSEFEEPHKSKTNTNNFSASNLVYKIHYETFEPMQIDMLAAESQNRDTGQFRIPMENIANSNEECIHEEVSMDHQAHHLIEEEEREEKNEMESSHRDDMKMDKELLEKTGESHTNNRNMTTFINYSLTNKTLLPTNSSDSIEQPHSPNLPRNDSQPSICNGMHDKNISNKRRSTEEINLEDACLLSDLFYLPFEHGPAGQELLDEFHWLKSNALSFLTDFKDIGLGEDSEIFKENDIGNRNLPINVKQEGGNDKNVDDNNRYGPSGSKEKPRIRKWTTYFRAKKKGGEIDTTVKNEDTTKSDSHPITLDQSTHKNLKNMPTSALNNEWTERAQAFDNRCKTIISLCTKMIKVRNKAVLFEFFPYVWDLKGVLTLVRGFLSWLALGIFPTRPLTSATLNGSPFFCNTSSTYNAFTSYDSLSLPPSPPSQNLSSANAYNRSTRSSVFIKHLSELLEERYSWNAYYGKGFSIVAKSTYSTINSFAYGTAATNAATNHNSNAIITNINNDPKSTYLLPNSNPSDNFENLFSPNDNSTKYDMSNRNAKEEGSLIEKGEMGLDIKIDHNESNTHIEKQKGSDKSMSSNTKWESGSIDEKEISDNGKDKRANVINNDNHFDEKNDDSIIANIVNSVPIRAENHDYNQASKMVIEETAVNAFNQNIPLPASTPEYLSNIIPDTTIQKSVNSVDFTSPTIGCDNNLNNPNNLIINSSLCPVNPNPTGILPVANNFASSNTVSEPAIIRGGLQAEFHRMLPLDTCIDLFCHRPPYPPIKTTYTIRPYNSLTDEDAIYKICRLTYDDGKDATHWFADHMDLPGDYLASAFLTLTPSTCFVLETQEHNQLTGFALCAPDSKKFLDCFEISVLPHVTARYSGQSLTSIFARDSRDLYEVTKNSENMLLNTEKGEKDDTAMDIPSHAEDLIKTRFTDYKRYLPSKLLQHYPSLVQFAFLPSVNDFSIPKRMLACLMSVIKLYGSTGIFAKVPIKHPNEQDFYIKLLGFYELTMLDEYPPEAIILGRAFY
ncbi:unnamed protein product [Gordionus sp. m RMFG-2023]|uniref:uncharacterized protein LOC135927530 isoform X2 n=1 Tax=Gordionus sp. m RMFG-2023 TaxID=3053472 RepID=UPI0030E2322A